MQGPRSSVEIQSALSGLALPAGVAVRAWEEADFPAIRTLALAQGWTTLRDRPEEALQAFHSSWPTLVATHEGRVIGFLRALTDGWITTYVATLLVAPEWRGQGIGSALLEACHHLCPATRTDLLSTDGAEAFYEARGFRGFPGFRKSYR